MSPNMVPIEAAGTEYLMKMPFAFLNRVSLVYLIVWPGASG
jgi:hypothetical protein